MGMLGVLALVVLAEAATLSHAGAHEGYCYAYFGNGKDDWCWTINSDGSYATQNCQSWDGYDSSKWCFGHGKESGDEGNTGEAETTGTTASDDGYDNGGNWKCGTWHKGGTPTDPEAKAWTAAHNIFRCMHDVEFVQWSNPVADDAQTYCKPLTSMAHSDSYGVKPPAGPAGENLYWAWSSSGDVAPPEDAVKSWYSEIKDPGCSSFPGCGGGFSHGTGHFTAMTWAGVKEIGCYSQPKGSHGLKICRYKGGDTMSCSTPNMGGCYKENLPAPVKSFSACKAKVDKCIKGGVPDTFKYFSKLELNSQGSEPVVPTMSLYVQAAGVGMAVALIGFVAFKKKRASYTPLQEVLA